jgi:uncharacterized protein
LTATPTIVGFGRTLRAAGVPAGPDRLLAFTEALSELDPSRRDDVYWAGRLTLCGSAEDVRRYDRVFDAYFSGWRPPVTRRTVQPRPVWILEESGPPPPPGEGPAPEPDQLVGVSASSTEVLRELDFAVLDAAQRDELSRLLAAFRLPGETRRTRRLRPSARGQVDRARTVRALLGHGGEPALLRYRRSVSKARRVVLLVDISGSMAPYAVALVRFAHAAARGRTARTEVFTLGTRLTRVTAELGQRDPDAALAAVARAVQDWSGGTRLGEGVKEFLDRWGQRGMARGAVVVVLSDGWERDDPALLGEQMARLARLAHRVVWANPRKARPGFAPLAGGMAAALPHVDDFVEGHSLAALERLARTVAGAVPPPSAGAQRR